MAEMQSRHRGTTFASSGGTVASASPAPPSRHGAAAAASHGRLCTGSPQPHSSPFVSPHGRAPLYTEDISALCKDTGTNNFGNVHTRSHNE